MTATDEKETRLQVLRRLLAAGGVRSQEELVEALGAQGMAVTQSSVSRDLRELGDLEGRLRAIRVIPEVDDPVALQRRVAARARVGRHTVAVRDAHAAPIASPLPGVERADQRLGVPGALQQHCSLVAAGVVEGPEYAVVAACQHPGQIHEAAGEVVPWRWELSDMGNRLPGAMEDLGTLQLIEV